MTGSPLIAAIDTGDLAVAESWAGVLAPSCAMLKVGLEFFCAHGPAGLSRLRHDVFLDLKLHDIPATVAGAVRAVLPLGPGLLTLHAAGGTAMIEAARRARDGRPGSQTRLLAVTVLTSLGAAGVAETGIAGDARAHVLRLARLALAAGADGLVCAGTEVAMLRDAFGAGPLLVVPGIRPEGCPTDDQSRVVTPRQAMDAGASYIVVGRPLTGAPDPRGAAEAMLASLR
jgi:orotidine-5'-phosphate decarboxylase